MMVMMARTVMMMMMLVMTNKHVWEHVCRLRSADTPHHFSKTWTAQRIRDIIIIVIIIITVSATIKMYLRPPPKMLAKSATERTTKLNSRQKWLNQDKSFNVKHEEGAHFSQIRKLFTGCIWGFHPIFAWLATKARITTSQMCPLPHPPWWPWFKIDGPGCNISFTTRVKKVDLSWFCNWYQPS